jgi:mannose-1-phosphate guanylyltransferase
VTRAVLALGFKPEPFLEAFPGGKCGNITLEYAVEPEPLDTAGAIAFAARHAGINSTFVVVNGDILTTLDISRVIAFHREKGAEGTLHLIPVDDPSQFGVVETDSDGRVMRFVEKPQPGEAASNNVNAGTYVLEPSVLDRVPAGAKMSIERVVFPDMVSGGSLYAMSTNDAWIDTGRPETFLAANLNMVGETGCSIVDPTAQVAGDAAVLDSVVGAGAIVGDGVALTRCVVFPGASVGARSSLTDSLVMGVVGESAVLANCVIGADGVVDNESVLTGAKVPSPDEA